MVIDITDSYVDIVTASHAVEQTAKPLVCFYGGSTAYGSVLAYGKYNDVAFIRVAVTDAPEGVMEVIKEAYIADNDAYSELIAGENVYMLGSSVRVAEDVVEGTIKEKDVFVALFQNDMLVCDGAVTDGMSGGGTFDVKGKLIGILVGTNNVEVAPDGTIAATQPDKYADITLKETETGYNLISVMAVTVGEYQ